MSYRHIGEGGELKEDCTVRRWEDLDNDILVKIMQSFDIFELTSTALGLAHVCSSWRRACCDPLIWKTLDLSMLKSDFIKLPMPPYVYVASLSNAAVTRLLKIALNLSQGHITTLIFHFGLYLSDDQFTHIAERTPRLKRLVLPAWNLIKEASIIRAMHTWKDLESLTMPSIEDPTNLIEEVAKNCNHFCELKVMGPFDIFFAFALVANLPKLRVLSVRCSTIEKDALIHILDHMQHLDVLNISHCLFIEVPEPPAPRKITRMLDQSIIEKGSCLREFITCMDESCNMCQRTESDEGFMRWYRYEEGLWKADEARSLAL